MTPQLQLFMVLGALVLLCIIFTLLKRGLMSVKYSLLWLLLAVAAGHCGGVPLRNLRIAGHFVH